MPNTTPVSGPHQFRASSGNAEAIQADAIVFIAERMAGIEWLRSELNNKMFKIQNDLNSDKSQDEAVTSTGSPDI